MADQFYYSNVSGLLRAANKNGGPHKDEPQSALDAYDAQLKGLYAAAEDQSGLLKALVSEMIEKNVLDRGALTKALDKLAEQEPSEKGKAYIRGIRAVLN